MKRQLTKTLAGEQLGEQLVNNSPSRVIHRLFTARRPVIHHLFTTSADLALLKAWHGLCIKDKTGDRTLNQAIADPSSFSDMGLAICCVIASAREKLPWKSALASVKRACISP